MKPKFINGDPGAPAIKETGPDYTENQVMKSFSPYPMALMIAL
tara:strand:+ start:32 stop:160 length:129 start_codon:yes stop_codon:yes gene_type:complete